MKNDNNMRKINVLIVLMGLMGFVGCQKENTGTDTDHKRDIFYSVNGSIASVFSGTTAHLNTESEFDALLDRFCNYAQGGAQVMFCSTHTGQKGTSTDTPTSISTTDREELKAWMKEMEKAGKTVNVTYDNGTWNGRAYANLGSDDMQEAQMYSGTLTFIPIPVLEEPPLEGVVLAMQVDDNPLIITLHGMMMWFDSIDDNMRLIEGAMMNLEGVVGTHTDLNGNTFMTFSLPVEEN